MFDYDIIPDSLFYKNDRDLHHHPAIHRQESIDYKDDAELRLWADKIGVTKVKLKAAINAAGPAVKAVEAYLNRRRQGEIAVESL